MLLDSLYQEIILDHYRSPHRHGLREPYDAQVHHVNPTCGDEITLRVTLGRDAGNGQATEDGAAGGEVVRDISYEAQGCSISQASTSVLTDLAVGKPLGEVLQTLEAFTEMVTSRGTVEGDEDVLGDGVAFAGVAKYPARVKCALLGWMAFKDAAAQAVSGSTDASAGSGQRSGGSS